MLLANLLLSGAIFDNLYLHHMKRIFQHFIFTFSICQVHSRENEVFEYFSTDCCIYTGTDLKF